MSAEQFESKMESNSMTNSSPSYAPIRHIRHNHNSKKEKKSSIHKGLKEFFVYFNKFHGKDGATHIIYPYVNFDEFKNEWLKFNKAFPEEATQDGIVTCDTDTRLLMIIINYLIVSLLKIICELLFFLCFLFYVFCFHVVVSLRKYLNT